MQTIKEQLAKIITKKLGVEITANDFTTPPNEKMGDISLPCFEFAKEAKKDPKLFAEDIVRKLEIARLADDGKSRRGNLKSGYIEKIESVGPFVNFFVSNDYLIENAFAKKRGTKLFGKKKIMLEFAHPNTHKMFHIGHLRNIITGESVARILGNVGNKVIRANYQGDVGLHIAKALYGINRLKAEFDAVKNISLDERVAFLGKAYAIGGQAYEADESAKLEIHELNKKIYAGDKSVKEIYELTRGWSLEYFDRIYKRLGTRFDRLYFESETFAKGKKIVEKFLKKGVFKQGEGAIIFEGEKYGLHNRVFITSEGSPTYEAKDLALAELQFKEYHPEKLIHVVGKEQTEYFKVMLKALEFTLPKSSGKEFHLPYGWVSLKSGKMSSRTGQVVLGEWLLDEIEKKIEEMMKEHQLEDREMVVRSVAIAAVKYAMLKINIDVDMAFDIDASISLSGDSGPYLLYICARINSILEKSEARISKSEKIRNSKLEIHKLEKSLLVKLTQYEEACDEAANKLNPSIVAKYLFDLAQTFNNFYQECPILQAEDEVKNFRLALIGKVKEVMEQGLKLLGIETVAKM
ncbi:MAG: arginine--tRNA ligase [Parcubacteria group bacterium]